MLPEYIAFVYQSKLCICNIATIYTDSECTTRQNPFTSQGSLLVRSHSKCRKISWVVVEYFEWRYLVNNGDREWLESNETLQWRHNEHDGVSNLQPHDCLFKRLFRRRSKKTSKLLVTGLCEGNSPVTGEFPTQRASKAENVSIWFRWRYHDVSRFNTSIVHGDVLARLGATTSAGTVIKKFRSMMTSSNGNIFRVTDHLCGEFTDPQWIPHTKASDGELWCFLWSAPE